jgi:hypothetical protein
MMGPDSEAEKANRSDSVNHRNFTKNFFITRSRDNMRDNTKTGKDKDVDFRMTKKPKKMLKKDRVTTTRRVKERRIKITIKK